MKKVLALTTLLAVTGLLLAGCPKAQEAANATADAAANAGRAADNAGAAAVEGVKDAAKGAAGALDTAKIKAAIIADAGLNDPANTINVDVTEKAVFLKGNVKNNDLKRKAGEIATKQVKDAGSTLEVKNMLLVK